MDNRLQQILNLVLYGKQFVSLMSPTERSWILDPPRILEDKYSIKLFCLFYEQPERSDTLIQYPVSGIQHLIQRISNE